MGAFFQAEDGIRDVERSRGLGDVYKRQVILMVMKYNRCLLYTSDAADDMKCVDLGGRRIIKKLRAAGWRIAPGCDRRRPGIFFFNDTATTEIYTLHIVGSVRCV